MIYTSPFKVDNVQETFDKLRKASGVIIFGTGNCGAIVQAALKKFKINILCLSDNNKHKWGKIIDGNKVVSPKELKSNNSEIPIIIAVDLNFPYIRKQLKEMGLTNVYDSDFIFSKLDLELKSCSYVTWSEAKLKQKIDLYMYSVLAHKDKEKTLKVDSVDLMLTEKCSLKCKDCSNLMQFYAKPIDEDFEIVISSINTFMNTVDFVQEIRLMGGEPLMYKKVDLVVKHLLTYKNFGQIKVNTNGTIVPKDEKLKVFQNEKIFFDISNYGKDSRNVDKLVKKLTEMNIAHAASRVTEWQDVGKIVKTNRTDSLNKEIFGNCCINRGLTLLHGKLYLCPFSANATNLKAIKYADEEILDLKANKEELKKQIHNLYFNTDFLEACRSCNGRDHNVPRVKAAVQAPAVLKYDVIA